MSFLVPQVLRCRFNRHAPVERKVVWDELHFIGRCRCCGIMIRRAGESLWLKDWIIDESEMPLEPREWPW